MNRVGQYYCLAFYPQLLQGTCLFRLGLGHCTQGILDPEILHIVKLFNGRVNHTSALLISTQQQQQISL